MSTPTKKQLRSIARHYGVRFSRIDSKRALRQRILARLRSAPMGTTQGAKDAVFILCIGLKAVDADSPRPGVISIRLRHTWFGWPWRWSNLRRVRAALPEFIPCGAEVELLR